MIEVDSSQLLNALGQLPPRELKKIIDTLFVKKFLQKPNFEEVSVRTRKIVKKTGLKPEVVGDAIKWARRQK